jgi:hypothetical protein
MVPDKSNGDNHVSYTDIPLGVRGAGDSMVLSSLNPAANQHPSMKEVSLDEFENWWKKRKTKSHRNGISMPI